MESRKIDGRPPTSRPWLTTVILAVLIVGSLGVGARTSHGGLGPASDRTTPNAAELQSARHSLRAGPPTSLNLPVHPPVLGLAGGLAAAQPSTARGQAIASNWWNTSPLSAAQPAPRGDYMMTYDASDGYVLLFGGGRAGTFLGDTWKFSGGTWTQLFPASAPAPRGAAGMTYDANDGYVLLFGGTNNSKYFADTWKFSAGIWSPLFPSAQPTPRAFPQIAYDSVDHEVVLFGGLNQSGKTNAETWRFSSGSWTQLAPATTPISRAAAAFEMDAKDGYLVLFAGTNNSVDYSDTWEFVGGAWTQLHPALSPSGRYLNLFVWDPIDAQLIMASGINFSASLLLSDTWAFVAGAWTLLGPTNAPDPRIFAQMTWDVADGYALYFWGVNRTGVERGGTWAYAPPLQSAASGAPLSVDARAPVTFHSNATRGIAPYTFHWSLGDATTNNSRNATHRYGASGSYQANVTVTDAVGVRVSENLTVSVRPSPTVRLTVPVSSVSAGTTVNFSTWAWNGTAPFSFAWTFGDGSTGTGANASHPYLAPGNYTATTTLTDAFGETANASVTLHVGARSAGGSPSSGSTTLLWASIGVIVVIAALVAFLIGRVSARGRSGPAAVTPYTGPPGPPPPGASGPPPGAG